LTRPVDLPPPPDPDPFLDPLAAAVVAEVVERGERASIAGVAARAGVSEREFRDRFASVEDCAVDAFERHIKAFERRAGAAFNARPDWRSALRAAAYETADFMEENPALLRFGITGVLAMKSEMARVRREEAFVFCSNLIDRGREEPGAEVDDRDAAMFAIGSIVQLLTHRLQEDGPVEPHAIVPEMMYTVVRTYLGDEAARAELTLPRPARAS
jgi:AcrR family transcriptional regulator